MGLDKNSALKWTEVKEEPTWIYLDHYRIRNICNLTENFLDRSVHLLEAAGSKETNQKMYIDENPKIEPMQEDEPGWNKILFAQPQSLKTRAPK